MNKLEKQKQKRKQNGNIFTKKYEKTKKGFLMRMYRNMKSRVLGIQKEKFHLYAGKDLLTKDEFYKWALSNNDFHLLFDSWEKSNYQRTLSPSIDRIDSSRGYCIDNIRFVTFSENCRNVDTTKRHCNRRMVTEVTTKSVYDSVIEASVATGYSSTHIIWLIKFGKKTKSGLIFRYHDHSTGEFSVDNKIIINGKVY